MHIQFLLNTHLSISIYETITNNFHVFFDQAKIYFWHLSSAVLIFFPSSNPLSKLQKYMFDYFTIHYTLPNIA